MNQEQVVGSLKPRTELEAVIFAMIEFITCMALLVLVLIPLSVFELIFKGIRAQFKKAQVARK